MNGITDSSRRPTRAAVRVSVAIVEAHTPTRAHLIQLLGNNGTPFSSIGELAARLTGAVPVVVVLGPSCQNTSDLATAERLIAATPSLGVILVAEDLSSATLHQAMRLGIRDVIALGNETAELGDAVRRVALSLDSPRGSASSGPGPGMASAAAAASSASRGDNPGSSRATPPPSPSSASSSASTPGPSAPSGPPRREPPAAPDPGPSRGFDPRSDDRGPSAASAAGFAASAAAGFGSGSAGASPGTPGSAASPGSAGGGASGDRGARFGSGFAADDLYAPPQGRRGPDRDPEPPPASRSGSGRPSAGWDADPQWGAPPPTSGGYPPSDPRLGHSGYQQPPMPKGKVVTVFSTKGGAGKSVIATNLAVTLAQRNQGPVCLVDADLQFGDVAVMLKLTPKHTIVDAVSALDRIDAGYLDQLLMLHEPSGLRVMPAPLEPAFADQIGAAEMVQIVEILRTFCSVVVVDTPAYFNDVVLGLVEVSDEILLVAGMDIPNIKNVKIGLQTLRLLGTPMEKVRLILNRANSKVKLDVGEVERTLQIQADCLIPSDIVVPQAVNKGVPVVLHAPKSGVARAISQLADLVSPDREAIRR